MKRNWETERFGNVYLGIIPSLKLGLLETWTILLDIKWQVAIRRWDVA